MENNYIILYITFGLGFYTGLALKSYKTFRKATVLGVISGIILGVLIWPAGILIQHVLNTEDK